VPVRAVRGDRAETRLWRVRARAESAPLARSKGADHADPITPHYRARGGTIHRVTVDRTPEGRWRVLDTAADLVIVVETLTGHDDREAQAQAVALDYAAEQQAFELGLRDHHPLPRRRPEIDQQQRWAA
jgi:hypothetical protein